MHVQSGQTAFLFYAKNSIYICLYYFELNTVLSKVLKILRDTHIYLETYSEPCH